MAKKEEPKQFTEPKVTYKAICSVHPEEHLIRWSGWWKDKPYITVKSSIDVGSFRLPVTHCETCGAPLKIVEDK